MSEDDQPKIKARKAHKTLRHIISIVLVFLILALIGIVGLGFWGVYNLSRHVTTAMVQFSQQIEADQHAITLLQEKLTSTEHALQQQAADFQQWRQVAQKGQDATRVLNAQYEVRLATDYLLLSSDVPRALRLFLQAREELNGITGAQIPPLQKALDDDIATLKNTPWVRSAPVYESLAALQAQVEKLPLVLLPAQNIILSPALSPPEASASTWQKGWQGLKVALQKMVVVYHTPDENSPPFITPDEGPYIRQNIIADLNGAMWAVLYRDNTVFHASLGQARLWIQEYVDPHAPATKAVLSALQAMEDISLHPSQPLVLLSPRAFQSYMKGE